MNWISLDFGLLVHHIWRCHLWLRAIETSFHSFKTMYRLNYGQSDQKMIVVLVVKGLSSVAPTSLLAITFSLGGFPNTSKGKCPRVMPVRHPNRLNWLLLSMKEQQFYSELLLNVHVCKCTQNSWCDRFGPKMCKCERFTFSFSSFFTIRTANIDYSFVSYLT